MRYFSSGVESGEMPAWYWQRGLHDAWIVRVEEQKLDYDVTQRNPVRNCMTIHLFNYKVLRDESDVGSYGEGLTGCYWMQDRIRCEKGKFLLDIIALGEDDFRYIVRFDFAEVERK